MVDPIVTPPHPPVTVPQPLSTTVDFNPPMIGEASPFVRVSGQNRDMILEAIRAWARGPLFEWANGWQRDLIAWLDDTENWLDSWNAEIVRYVQDVLEAVINNSIELQDPLLAAILGDDESLSSQLIAELYIPSADEKIVYVSLRGDDENTGLTERQAVRTLPGAVARLGGQRGVIQVGAGTLTTPGVALPSGTTLRGLGMDVTTISVTEGVAIGVATPGVRSYSYAVSDLTLRGPGKTVLGAIGIDLDSVSTSQFQNVKIIDFQIGFRIRSLINGGSLYNRLIDVDIRTCGTGLDITAVGSNANVFAFSRVNQCDIGVSIVDANDNHVIACQIEKCTLGALVDATTNAKSDYNSFDQCRFEENVTAWEVRSAFVRGTKILNPFDFQAYIYIDNGTRTTITGPQYYQHVVTVTDAKGSFLYRRTSAVPTETPMMVFEDTNATSGVPVTVESRVPRAAGYAYRARRQNTNDIVWDVDGQGNTRQLLGAYHEMTERAAAPGAVAGGARIYLSLWGGKLALFVRFPTGDPIRIATEV